MSVTIRPAVVGDEQALAVLNGVVHDLHVANKPEHFKPVRLDEVAAWHEIDQIGVTPDRKRQGVGRALVRTVLADAHVHGIRDVELSSWSFNQQAHEAFRKLGFAPIRVRFGLERP